MKTNYLQPDSRDIELFLGASVCDESPLTFLDTNVDDQGLDIGFGGEL